MQQLTGIPAVATLATADDTGDRLPILPLWGELIFGLVAFAILYFIVAKYVVPRLEELYAERSAAIEGGMKQAEEAQAQAQAALHSYETQLHEARSESNKIREEARAQGAAIVAEMREQAQAEANRITESAKKQIDAERQAALVSLRGEIGGLSTELASRIVGESLEDRARQSGIIDRFLAELESGEVKPEKVGAAASAEGHDETRPDGES